MLPTGMGWSHPTKHPDGRHPTGVWVEFKSPLEVDISSACVDWQNKATFQIQVYPSYILIDNVLQMMSPEGDHQLEMFS